MEGVELRGRFHVDDDAVLIEYSVENYREEDIYLTDVTIRVGPQGSFRDIGASFVVLEEPDTAVISSYLLPWPPGVSWTVPPTVYATRVLSGRSFQGTLEAQRPLRTMNLDRRYQAEIATQTEDVECHNLRFDLGVIPHNDALDVRDVTIAGLEVAELAMNAVHHQEILSVERSGFDITVTRGL